MLYIHFMGTKSTTKFHFLRFELPFQTSNNPDPTRNRALARCLEAVLAEKLGKDFFDSVIKRSQDKGVSAGKQILINVQGPSGIYGIVEAVGKNEKFILHNGLASIFKKNLFVIAPKDSAKGIFEKRGIVCVEGGDAVDFDKAEELAIESGAEEVKEV